jgi:hypothetical protein
MIVRPAAVVVVTLVTGVACSSTPSDPAARGRQIVERMSAALASAKALSVTTREIRDRVKRDGSLQKIQVTRETVVRRPDRAYFRTTGVANLEGWYDGIGLTLVMHDHKVFGQARLPETLDRALDAIHERYDVPMPLSDFIYSNPAKALLADTTTGGWVSRETMDGHDVDHVAFKEKGLEWELWVPTTGTPLPLKAILRFPNSNRLRAADVTFSNWNLAPDIPADRFNPHVGEDYEGIAIIQRAAIVRHADEKAPATDPAKKP